MNSTVAGVSRIKVRLPLQKTKKVCVCVAAKRNMQSWFGVWFWIYFACVCFLFRAQTIMWLALHFICFIKHFIKCQICIVFTLWPTNTLLCMSFHPSWTFPHFRLLQPEIKHMSLWSKQFSFLNYSQIKNIKTHQYSHCHCCETLILVWG